MSLHVHYAGILELKKLRKITFCLNNVVLMKLLLKPKFNPSMSILPSNAQTLVASNSLISV